MLNTILTSKADSGQDFEPKNHKRRSLLDSFSLGCESMGSLRILFTPNNQGSFTFVNKLPKKNLGDTATEKKRERQAKQLDHIFLKLSDELNNNKYQLSKIRKKFETTDDNGLLEQIATIDQRNREIDAILTGKDSHVFGTNLKDHLGLSNELQELIKSGFLDRLKDQREQQKNTISEFNRPTKFTSLARRRCMEGGEILQQKYGDNVLMGTFTLPGRSEKAKQAIAQFSSLILNRLTQVLRDYAKYHGIEIDYEGSWEPHQDDTLHLHLPFGFSHFETHRKRLEELLWDAWIRILDDMGTTDPVVGRNNIGHYPGIDMYQRVDKDINNPRLYKYRHIESWKDHKDILKERNITVNFIKCNQNPGNYVSKYVSKESAKVKKPDSFYFPRRWWCMSKGLKDEAKAQTIDQVIPIGNDDQIEVIEYIKNLIEQWQENGYINPNFNEGFPFITRWDIYSQLDQNNKSIRVNRKPWQPRPANCCRVSNGVKIISYFNRENFLEVKEAIAAIANIAKAVNTMSPKDFSLFDVNKYYVNNQEIAIDSDSKVITARRHNKHRNYWEKIAAGENYKDIVL
jgi:hypothetical protein